MTIVHRSQQLFDSEKQPEIENEGEGSHTKVIWFSESLILKTLRKGGMSLQSAVCLGLHYNYSQESILFSENISLNI